MRIPSTTRLASALALAIVLSAGVRSAGAQTPNVASPDRAQVERLLTRAVELRRAGKDAEALPLIEQARVLSPTSRVQAHLAAAHQALGHWLEAEQLLKKLLEKSDDAYVDSQAARLKRAYLLVQQHLGRIDVLGEPAQAEVFLSGRRLGVLPLTEPVSVELGSYVLEVRMAGYHPVIRPVTVAAGGFLREAVALEPAAASPAVAADDKRLVAGSAAAPTDVAPASNWVTWSLAGLGTAAAATGAVAWWMRERHASRWNSNECLAPQLPRGQVCPSERSAAILAGRVAIGSGIAAGALLGGALVSLLLEKSPPADQPSALGCGVGWASATCFGSF